MPGEHTPGPWKASPFSSIVGCPISAQPDPKRNTIVIGSVHGAAAEDREGYRAEVEANARLISAAPEMLPLLYQYKDDLLHPVTDSGSRTRRLEAIDRVLSKALPPGQKT